MSAADCRQAWWECGIVLPTRHNYHSYLETIFTMENLKLFKNLECAHSLWLCNLQGYPRGMITPLSRPLIHQKREKIKAELSHWLVYFPVWLVIRHPWVGGADPDQQRVPVNKCVCVFKETWKYNYERQPIWLSLCSWWPIKNTLVT